ncbi:MAG: hypothetical protein IT429_08035 [Gemmataceae bacterium]|nr:hypothetical protein [Gemmataceae bacterium]
MSAKTAFSSALVLAALSVCAARAQAPPAMPYPQAAVPEGIDALNPPPPPNVPGPPGHVSNWISYKRPWSCCGPLGGNGPVGTELFIRSGISVVAGGGVFADTLQTGWAIEGGARSLFFDTDLTGAWTVSYSVSNVNNHGKRPDIRIPLQILVPTPPTPQNTSGGAAPVHFGVDVPGVTVQSLNRTYANLGFGREWWLLGSANCDGRNWRAGLDVGGRWGSANLGLQELRHRSDVIGAVWVALHTDVEIPWACYAFIAGFRVEWDYTWSDILQRQNNSDLTTFNLLANFGVRF